MQKLTTADIDRLQAVDLRTVDRSILKDIQDVKVDTGLSKKERILDYINQIGNPYCYCHGDYIVKVSFTDTDVTLEERMLSYIQAQMAEESGTDYNTGNKYCADRGECFGTR